MKKAISLFLALLPVCLTCPVVFAEEPGFRAFGVNPYGGGNFSGTSGSGWSTGSAAYSAPWRNGSGTDRRTRR